MSECLLTICVVTLACEPRRKFLARLMDILAPQIQGGVQVLVDIDDGDFATGKKRHDLLSAARGRFVCMVDDDDTVSNDYIASLLSAIRENPDAEFVGFKVEYSTDGGPARDFPYPFPSQLGPVRTDIAREVGIETRTYGEDNDYHVALKAKLTRGVTIPKPLYHWRFRTDRAGERVHELINFAGRQPALHGS